MRWCVFVCVALVCLGVDVFVCSSVDVLKSVFVLGGGQWHG